MNSLKNIDNADQYCQMHEALLDKEDERAQWEQQTSTIEKSGKIQQQILDALRDVLATRAADREDDHQRKILHCLAADYAGQKNFNPRRVPGTCRWFLDDPRFHRWRDSTESSLLWLSTGPGCGKSVLSRALIDEMLLTTQLMTSTVCYFFFKDSLERRQRGEDALCGILHQLYSQNLASGLINHAYQPFKSYGRGLRSMFYPLWNLLMATAGDSSSGEVICLLDALDECQADARQQLLDQLRQFYDDTRQSGPKTPRIKFLITSRPNSDIDGKFRLLGPEVNFIVFAGDDRSDLISQEINLVIDQRMPEVVPRLDSASRCVLADHLKGMQHRTYLWLHLVMEEIRLRFASHATVKRIETLLQQLPTSVVDAYENILGRSVEPEAARIILQIVLAATRPLTVDEMTVAVAIARTKYVRSYEDLDLESDDVRESNLRNMCGFFISISDSKVSLIHQTARDFLLKSDTENGSNSTSSVSSKKWQGSVDLVVAEHTVARVCIALLLFDVYQKRMPWSNFYGDSGEWHYRYQNLTSSYPLLNYASTGWSKHYRASQHMSVDEEIGLALSICDIRQGYFQTWFPIYWYTEKSGKRPSVTALVVASTFGFTTVVRKILFLATQGERDVDAARRPTMSGDLINESTEYYGTALQVASGEGHVEIVKLLLDSGADVNAPGKRYSDTALQAASAKGHVEIVKLLLDSGADVNAPGKRYGTALQMASAKGHVEIVKLLLDSGADVNAPGGYYATALQMASAKGHVEIVKLLLDSGADVNAPGGYYGTALQVASGEGHVEIVKLLLDSGADVNAPGKRYSDTTLQAASAKGHVEIVKLLLDSGADVNAPGGYYGTALQAASAKGHVETVKLLLDSGADVNAPGERYGTALQIASEEGHVEIVKLLLDSGALNT
ncbi:hypothetical protein AYL99_11255 [Fonsecaea erecta]|uniref:Uncharacterized protein n=1 Tax=Fonsecaea erecta TaxID=1367422 RepID=A0A178Z4Y0_9EURO|nr:hypothetical protein AYL99_11255 [Fonsecaea erecta]OAP54807.1 hypothetical protein AYL99_11255 [Fonsecaea erecta]